MTENQTVRLIVTTGCAHCQTVLQALIDLLKSGGLGRLEIVNAAVVPVAGVRSSPTLDLGEGIILEGERSAAELAAWLRKRGTPEAMADYFHELLIQGRRGRVEDLVREEPHRLLILADLLRRPDAGINVRLGIGAVLEELAGTGLASVLIEPLTELVKTGSPLVRADACHFLFLAAGADATPVLRSCLDDEDPAVREVAADALADLS